MRRMGLFRLAASSTALLGLQGCMVATVVGTAADVGIEVAKVPFKVGGAVYDLATDPDDEAKTSGE